MFLAPMDIATPSQQKVLLRSTHSLPRREAKMALVSHRQGLRCDLVPDVPQGRGGLGLLESFWGRLKSRLVHRAPDLSDGMRAETPALHFARRNFRATAADEMERARPRPHLELAPRGFPACALLVRPPSNPRPLNSVRCAVAKKRFRWHSGGGNLNLGETCRQPEDALRRTGTRPGGGRASDA